MSCSPETEVELHVFFLLLFELSRFLRKEVRTVTNFFYYTKKYHSGYVELCGFSLSSIAVGKLEVGIVSLIIGGAGGRGGG